MNKTADITNTATYTVEFKDREAAKAWEEIAPNTIDTYRKGTSWYVVGYAEEAPQKTKVVAVQVTPDYPQAPVKYWVSR